MTEHSIILIKRKVLTTAEILYHMPDFPELLQSFIWQQLDVEPYFPELRKFLDYWSHNLDGRLHSVRLAKRRTGVPKKIKLLNDEFLLH